MGRCWPDAILGSIGRTVAKVLGGTGGRRKTGCRSRRRTTVPAVGFTQLFVERLLLDRWAESAEDRSGPCRTGPERRGARRWPAAAGQERCAPGDERAREVTQRGVLPLLPRTAGTRDRNGRCWWLRRGVESPIAVAQVREDSWPSAGPGPACGHARHRRPRKAPSEAQLHLFEEVDVWRYHCGPRTRPTTTRGLLGQIAVLEARHRAHAWSTKGRTLR